MIRSLLLLAFAAGLQAQNIVRLEAGAEPGKATLADVAWLAGWWRGHGLGGDVEEVWTKPAAGSMIGMFRVIRDNKLWFSELMSLSEENGSLVLRVKHFHPDLKGWEEKDKSLDFKLVRIDDRGAWFDGLSLLKDGNNGMRAVVLIKGRGETAFEYKRER
jgi:hypothetical protein